MNNNKKVIILNGPPDSGKDFGAAHIVNTLTLWDIKAHHQQFKRKLFELVLAIFNIDKDVFFTLYNNRKTKEKSTPLLNGFSPRNAMIFVSEEMIKPVFGNDYFGKCAEQNLKDGVNVFSDGGFVDEIDHIYESVGKDNLLIARIHRLGRTFEGDSRTYIKEYKDVKIINIYNDYSKEAFCNRLNKQIINKFIFSF